VSWSARAIGSSCGVRSAVGWSSMRGRPVGQGVCAVLSWACLCLLVQVCVCERLQHEGRQLAGHTVHMGMLLCAGVPLNVHKIVLSYVYCHSAVCLAAVNQLGCGCCMPCSAVCLARQGSFLARPHAPPPSPKVPTCPPRQDTQRCRAYSSHSARQDTAMRVCLVVRPVGKSRFCRAACWGWGL
jgi:hypothetical protein